MGINLISGNNIQTTYGLNTEKQEKRSSNFSDLVKEKSESIVPPKTEVSISGEGLDKSQEERLTTNKSADSTKLDPVEDVKYYQVPKWMYGTFSSTGIVQLGTSGIEVAQSTSKFTSLSNSDRAYFQEATLNHWSEFLKENGLSGDKEKYYQTLIANKESSEEYRLKWEEKISSDTRLMEIYKKGKRL